jgi:hypothetical protein
MENKTNVKSTNQKLHNSTKYSDVSKGYVPGCRISRKIFKTWGKAFLKATQKAD